MIGEGLFLYTTTDGEVIGVSLPSLSFSRFTQPTPSSRWHFTHDLGYLPLVQVYDETGHIITESVHVSVTNTTVTVETENGVLVGGYLTLMGASGSSGDGAEYVKLSDLGNYALVSALNAAVSTLQTEIDGKQSAGNYVLQQAFASAISSLQTAVDGKQSTGEYARLVQGVIPTSQLPNDWLINTTTVGSDAEMLALTQFRRGDFVWRSDQNAYYDLAGNDPTVIGNWQRRIQATLRSVNAQTGPDVVLGYGDVGAAPAGDYVLNSALANYVLTTAFNQSVANLQTAINGKQNTGDYVLNSVLANYVLTTAFNQSVANLQTAINGKQNTGDYALNSALANYVLTTAFNQSVANLQASIDTKQPLIQAASIITIEANTTITPNRDLIPFTLAGNVVGQTGTLRISTTNVRNGQRLTLINTSDFWLALPVSNATGALQRLILPKESLSLTFSSDLNSWVADSAFKGFQCRATNSTAVSAATGTTYIPFDTITYDTSVGAIHSTTVNNTQFIAPTPGVYQFIASANFTGTLNFSLLLNRGLPQAGLVGVFRLNQGNFVELAVSNPGASAINVSSLQLSAIMVAPFR
jgi:hypothetical protein